MEPYEYKSVTDVPVLGEGEAMLGSFGGLLLFFSSRKVGNGTLFITSKNCFWRPDEVNAVTGTRSTGYVIDWEEICMHAICSDESVLAFPHLYCMSSRELDDEVAEINRNLETHSNTNDIRFAPITPRPELLQQLFDLFSKAANMIPDSEFKGEFVTRGDFNEKRKMGDREAEDEAEEAFTTIDPEMLERLMPDGTDLSPAEVERRLAEWDSKLVIEEGEEQVPLPGSNYHPYPHNRTRGQGNRGENSGLK
eukprot:TRINITY_DN1369_c0_g1_i2.p1 TRINITY_DN1369_c0_g1~~TRINITY_DN1369_c0_g1_i2.p1  ORF type:complete len:251 (+),score=65.65 TRINITY_DN1369_c0_g1_i2:45-797(+)